MADDLISLGFDISSSPFLNTSEAMDKMAVSAGKVETAAESLTATTTTLTAAETSAATATDKASAARAASTRVLDVQDAAYRRAMAATNALAISQADLSKTADLQARSFTAQGAAAISLGTTIANTAKDVAANYNTMSAAANKYANDVERTVQRLKVAETYTASLNATAAMNSSQASANAAKEVAANYNSMSAAANKYATDMEKTVQRLKVTEAYTASLNAKPNISPVGSSTNPGVGGAVGLTPQQKLILGYQINDIFTSVMGGMSPTMIAAQQGPQITQIFGGLRQTIAAIPKPALIAGGGILAGLGIAAAISSLKDLSDAEDEQKRKLSSLLESTGAGANAYALITKEAIKTGKTIDDVTVSFTKFVSVTQSLGATVPQMLALSKVTEQLGKLGGLDADATAAGAAAVAKLLVDSVVSADALQSVFDKMPTATKAIADSLGISTSQLKLMAQQGDLTNKQVFSGLLTQTESIQKEFSKLPVTVGSLFTSLVVSAESFAASLYKSVVNIQLIGSKADNITRRQQANPNLPARATPRVIGDPNGVSDVTTEMDLAAGMMSKLDINRAITAQADATVIAAAKIGDAMDTAGKEVKLLNDQIATTQTALDKLQGGMTTFDSSTATDEVKKLTAQLALLQEKANNAKSAYDQALNDIAIRQNQDASGVTLGQRTFDAKVQTTAKNLNITTDQATPIVNSQQSQEIDNLVEKQKLVVLTQTAMTQAMKGGKISADNMAASLQALGLTMEQFGNLSDSDKAKLEEYVKLLQAGAAQARAQASIDASKPLIAQLDGIAAAYQRVEDGAYAMKYAQAEAVSFHNETGTGQLELDVLKAQQALTDKQTIYNLQVSIALTNTLAEAAGDVNKQKKIQLDYDIEMAQRNADAPARAAIAESMRAKAIADTNREAKESLATMEDQTKASEAQLAIIREGAPDMNAQLAMLAKKNELMAKGVDIITADNQKQISEAGKKASLDEQIQYAKDAADATKRTWQNAYDNIQTAGADTFFDIFSGAEVNGKTVADSLKNIFLHAFAEIASAAIIKPLITPVFQLGADAGLIPAGVVPGATGSMNSSGILSFLGLGGSSISPSSGATTGSNPYAFADQSGAYGGFGSSTGGRSTYQIIGQSGGLNGLFGAGGFQGFKDTPIFSNGIDSEIANWSTYGTSAQGSAGLLSSNATYGQAFGAAGGALGIGMGINTLLNSKGSAGGIIGGAAGILGGGLGIAGALMPALAGTLGPIGIGVGLLGALLPSLLGGGGPVIPPMPALAYGYGGFAPTAAGGYSYGGDALGSGTALNSQAKTLANSLTTAFKSAGLMVVPGSLIGGGIASGTAHMWDGKQWQDSAYTQTGLIGPNGAYTSLTANDTSRSPDQAAQYLLAQAFKANVMQGGVSGAGAGLKAGLNTINPVTTDDLNRVISLGTAYDKLGKAVNPAKDAIDNISASFDDLKNYASEAGLSLQPIDDEIKKQSVRSAQDFIDAMLDPLAVQMRALDDAKDQAITSAEYIRDNVKSVNVDINQIVDYYGKQRLQLEDQYYGGAITNLKNLLQSLTYGDLSNASPTTALAGLQSEYDTTLAKARSGDVSAIADFSTVAGNLADTGRNTYGNSVEFETMRKQILADVAEVQARISGGTATGTATTSPELNAAIQVQIAANDQLREIVQTQSEQIGDLKNMFATVTAQNRSFIRNGTK